MTREPRTPGFALFWTASTVSTFGSYVTTVAVGVLVSVTLGGSSLDQGWVNAARWAPYLLVGLLAGVVADRVRRRPLLVGTGLGRGVVLALVPVLWATGELTVASVAAVLFGFGLLSVFGDAAQQSLLPRLVPTAGLARANTALHQSEAVAQGGGPLLGGALAGVIGAPLTLAVDAVGQVVAAVLVWRTPLADPRPPRAPRRAVLGELREGLVWLYRHPTLRPLALATHVWFVGNAAVGTVAVAYSLDVLDLGAFGFGVTTAGAGVGALLGTTVAGAVGRRTGGPGTVVLGRALETAGVLTLAGLPLLVGPALPAAVLGQVLFGFGMGLEGPFEMTHRQTVTPDHLQGRTNATMRSLNRAAVVLGAPLGGALAVATSPRVALTAGALLIAATAVGLAVSGFRRADEVPAA
ncbi:hypothetical protein ASG36_17970 [Geodermatophilus sp. Leaf369]|uniref:MFS transporter n=1 Tax=Geodermatophilus sp. Leaf369 TaxID=1736354 RepID=UPI0006F7B91A|nr:MFS transporter [Geodermatophilus sp. Leaf369]KQS56896.1 hypothetical protein ASG36_17970 [Geodermatophilus sp. Leaf369]